MCVLLYAMFPELIHFGAPLLYLQVFDCDCHDYE